MNYYHGSEWKELPGDQKIAIAELRKERKEEFPDKELEAYIAHKRKAYKRTKKAVNAIMKMRGMA